MKKVQSNKQKFQMKKEIQMNIKKVLKNSNKHQNSLNIQFTETTGCILIVYGFKLTFKGLIRKL